MENQWQQLRAVLNGEHSERDGLSGQFFNRLLYCLDDVQAGECDRLHAFYDALQCARAFGLMPLRLPYRHLTEGVMLQHFGLRRDRDYPGELFLTCEAEEIDPSLLPVWKGEQRRFWKPHRWMSFCPLYSTIRVIRTTHLQGNSRRYARC